MTTINPYLAFTGNCEEAFNFYRSVFGGDFRYIGRYKDMPPADRQHFPPEADEKIMHVSLPISKETILMGCDSVGNTLTGVVQEQNISLSITTDNQKEADRLFYKLSDEGEMKMPMTKTFWGSILARSPTNLESTG